MPDILLIQPPIRDFYFTKKRSVPYGLASIASALIQRGFNTEILDSLATRKSKILPLPEEMSYLREFYQRPDTSPFSLFFHYRHYGYSYQHIGAVIARSGAFLVGISSLFTPYKEEALAVVSLVKETLPGCTVVMGGHHPTALPEDLLRHQGVDFVIRGEGEQSMVLLAAALRDKSPWHSIPGLCYRDEGGKPVVNPPALLDHPDDLPLPAIHLLNTTYYQRKGKGTMVIMTGKGCPLACSYCSVSKHSYLPFRRRPVDSVIRELDAGIESGARFIDFEDENLSLNRAWFMGLLETISSRYRGMELEFRAMNGLLPTTLDESMVAAMKEIGFHELNLSLCTVSSRQLKRFSRPDVRSAFENVLEWAETYGLTAVGYIIIGAPWQTAAESLNDLLYLADKRVLAGVSVYYPSPGSPDFSECERENLLPASLMLTRSTALPVSHTTTRIETVTLLRIGRILNYLKYLKNPGKGEILSEADEKGRGLLDLFFADGNIRGVDDNGEVYKQAVQPELCQAFIKALKTIAVRAQR